MENLFIHIGLHKTATTSLQNTYFPSLEGLSYFRYSVPDIYTELGMYELQDNVLITNEGLSGIPWNDEWINGIPNDFDWTYSFKTAVINLKRLHPNATILVMFRKHGDLLVSLYKQYIHEGGILPFESFYGTSAMIQQKDLDFSNKISFLNEHFEDVVIFSFEEFKKKGAQYLNSYFEQFGLKEVKPDGKRKVYNKSVVGKKLLMLKSINKYYRYLPLKLRKLLRRARISPRDIFQNKLSFWKAKELSYLEKAKLEVNQEFISDWEYIESLAWKQERKNVNY